MSHVPQRKRGQVKNTCIHIQLLQGSTAHIINIHLGKDYGTNKKIKIDKAKKQKLIPIP